MGAIYTRQSTYADGDTITAAHTNDEFDQLLAAFAASTGHTHDGTTAEGGPITKLLGTSITIGNATSGTDITVTFDGESNDGVLKWMEDEDYFEFSDDLLIASTEKIQFRDTGLYINSSADGQLDIVADTEVQIAATTVDINGAVDVSGNLTVGGNLDVTGTFNLSDSNFTNAGDIQLDSISGDSDTNTSITFSGSDVITVTTGGETQITFNNGSILPTTDNDVDLGSSSLEFKDIYIDGTAYLDAINFNGTAISATAAELNIMDGVTSTTADLNILDGVTSTTAELNILDGVTSTTAELNILDGVTSTTAELNILDGVTSTVAELNILDGVTSTTTELNILDGVTSTTAELNILDGVTSTAAELNILDVSNSTIGDLTEISTVANDDVFLAIDTSGGGLKKVTRSTLLAGSGTSSDIANVVEDTSPQLGGNLDLNGADIVTTSNATLDLAPNGTGTVVVRGNTNSGAIVFNCESNSHGQKVFGQPHSASVENTLMLPAGANSTLVSLVSTDTLTNKTLTSPKINEDVAVTSTATELNLLDGVTSTTAELNLLDGVTSTTAELNLLDGVTSTTAELNLIDGGTTRGTTAVASGDGILINDAGTMRMTNVDTVSTYFAGHSVGGANIVTTGALNSGSITSGFGTIDTGSSAITTTGLISGGSLDIDNVLINGTTIGHTDDTDLITLADGALTVAGTLAATTGTFSGIIKTDDSTAATSTTDGSLQTDGGLSVVLDAVIGDDLLMLSDASVIHFGADSDVTLTHVADVGLALKHTATADDKPIVLTLQTGETDMAANDVIGKLAFQAPDEGTGTDAILVAAAVQAVAEGNFSSSNNATRLEFHTGASELAAVKMTLNSTGAVKPVTYQETYVSLSAAGTVNCPLLTANHFAVTIDENTTFTFGDPPASGTSFSFILIVTQHSTAVTLTWPNTVDWAGGSAPDAAGNNEVQAYGFITRDGGTTYYGFLGGTAIG